MSTTAIQIHTHQKTFLLRQLIDDSMFYTFEQKYS